MGIDISKDAGTTSAPSAQALPPGTARNQTSDLEARLSKAADRLVHLTMKAVGAAGRVAHDNQGRVNTAVGKAGAAFDQRTHGKYATKVSKFQSAVNSGVTKAAGYRDR